MNWNVVGLQERKKRNHRTRDHLLSICSLEMIYITLFIHIGQRMLHQYIYHQEVG